MSLVSSLAADLGCKDISFLSRSPPLWAARYLLSQPISTAQTNLSSTLKKGFSAGSSLPFLFHQKFAHNSENLKGYFILQIQPEAGIAAMTTRICVAIRSFEKHPIGLPACTRRIRLPDTRVLFTVLRSPHIDKKSREQFEMITKRQLLIIDAKANELQKKFFWLKRQRILGAQYALIFNSKTRLDKGKLQALLNKETETTPAELGLKSIVSSREGVSL